MFSCDDDNDDNDADDVDDEVHLTTMSGRVCRVVLSWSAGDRVSGRYMALDSRSREVGICCFRCNSSH